MEDKENEEFRKRIRDSVDRVEKDKNTPEFYRQFLEKIEELKQSAILDIDDKRNDISIIGFASVIQLYKGLDTDPNSPYEKDQFQKEINSLYQLIYEELKKPNPFLRNLNHRTKHLEIKDRKRLLVMIKKLLGEENFNHFYKNFKIRKLVGSRIKIIGFILYFFIVVSVFMLISLGIANSVTK